MQSEQKISNKVIMAIIATGIMSFCGVVVETAMNITFPTLMKQFNVSTSTVQWMTTIYLLVVAIIVPLSATFKQNFKTKQLFIFANIMFILGVFIDTIAPSFTILLIGRAIQGIGTGIALPLMFNIILEQVPMSKIGMMMGIGTLITAVAPAVGPTFGGVVVSSIGWRYIFIFLIPLLVISLFLGIFNIQQKSEIKHSRFDIIGSLFITLGLSGLIFGFSNLGNTSFIDLKVGGAITIGIISILMFVWRSSQIKNPIINVKVLGNLNFSGHVFAFFIFQLVSLGLSFLLPNYIQLVNHSSAVLAGLIVLPGALIGAVFAPLGGRILDTIGPKWPLTMGSGIALIVLLIFVFNGTSLSNLLIGCLYFFFMIGIGLSFGNLMTNGLKQLDSNLHSHGNAILTTMQQFSGAVGTSLTAAFVATKQTKQVTLSHGTAAGSDSALIFLITAMLIEFIVLVKVVDFPFKSPKNK